METETAQGLSTFINTKMNQWNTHTVPKAIKQMPTCRPKWLPKRHPTTLLRARSEKGSQKALRIRSFEGKCSPQVHSKYYLKIT
jgi:hypothetical protein